MATTSFTLTEWVLASSEDGTPVIGYSGENETEEIVITCDEILSGYTYMLDVLNSSGDANTVTLTVDDTDLTLTLTSEVLTFGALRIQVVAQNTDGKIKKSNMLRVIVRESINATESFPDDVPTAVEELLQQAITASTEASESAESASASATEAQQIVDSLVIDDEMSSTSENPVQNKVIYSAIPKNVKDGTGAGAVIEGTNCTASGSNSHAEGYNSTASGNNSHAEGGSTASGVGSHAEGFSTKAVGMGSHAEGWYSESNAYASHSQNGNTIANGKYQTVLGKFNEAQGDPDSVPTDTDYAVIIGNGTGAKARSNALAIRWDGKFVAPDNETVYEPWTLANILSSGQAGQILMSDGNGGFQWVNLADLIVYPGGISL